ncbi:hypothetical protein ACFVUS_31085 [Nocardia sp. NPDC058058]|uniref:hypothetical protein n=1 Tax=Nocardia sp. NPDC058058 TaxID=3346317 RepID=UPI0036DB8910
MFVFSDEFLVPRLGTIRYLPENLNDPTAESWSITVPLAPFSATDIYDPNTFRVGTAGPEIIKTALRLDWIEVPATQLDELSGRTFTFPVNPEGNFIDTTIYLGGGHCLVDVTRIDFGHSRDGQIQATLHAEFDFDSEGVEIENRAAVMTTNLYLTT